MINEKIMKASLEWHLRFQSGCYFSEIKVIKGATISWSNKIKDSYWNYAQIDAPLNEVQTLIASIETFFKNKNRTPAIYVTPFTKPKLLPEILLKSGFKPAYKDACMFYEGTVPQPKLPESFKIMTIKTEKDMETFINTFKMAYGGATLDEPYGALPPEYHESLSDSFKKREEGKTTWNYLGFLNGRPVSIATVIFSDDYGCIYNVGIIPEGRRKGLGTSISLHCVSEAMKMGVKTIFLQTEKDSYNERFYRKLGFSTKFIGEGFVLK